MSDLSVRRATAADLAEILGLLQRSMGRAADERFDTLFRWKHLENAFGPSPMWVACSAGRIVGLRVFMRWEFDRAGRVLRAVRAVDTATDPDFQGRGIFRDLTMRGVEELRAEGVDFVFNTPNDKSRPGYLKMGWSEVGRAAAAVHATRLVRLVALRGARTAAAHWSEPILGGVSVDDVLRDRTGLEDLLRTRPAPDGGRLRTRVTPEFVVWRFGTPLLGYRAVLAGDRVTDGVAFVRVRKRGDARECVVAQLLLPGRDRGSERRLIRRVVRAVRADADYLLAIGRPPGFVPLPSLGPVVTTRPVSSPAPQSIAEFDLGLGDVELF